jgi:hypothetical protein
MARKAKDLVQGAWTAYGKGGKQVLVMLQDDINTFAGNREWRKVAQHCFYARQYGGGGDVGRILKAAFGDCIKWVDDKTMGENGVRKHQYGRIQINEDRWPKGTAFDLAASNTWGLVVKGVEDAMAFNGTAFQKELKAVVQPAKEKPNKTFLERMEQVVKYLQKTMKDTPEVAGTLTHTVKEYEALIAMEKAKEPAF